MSYNEKLNKLATEFGVTEDAYFNMIKNEVVIDGLILWGAIVILMISLITMFIYGHQCDKKGKFGNFDFIIPITFFIVLANVAIFVLTDFYTIPLNNTFNTDYVVIQRINEMLK